MKVSVIMPVYNGGERMRRTIDSVLAQSWREVSFENLALSDGRRVNGRRINGKIAIEE